MGIPNYNPSDIHTVERCEVCGGKGTKLIEAPSGYTSKTGEALTKTVSQVCICKKNEFMERNWPEFHPGSVKFVDEKNARAAVRKLKADDFSKEVPSYVFRGPNKLFHYLMKSVFVYHAFDSSVSLHISDMMRVIEHWYAPPEGSCRSMSELEYDRSLLVLRLGFTVENRALKPLTHDLINSRLMSGRPVWVWYEGDLRACGEYSDNLNNLFKSGRFVEKELASIFNSAKSAATSIERARNASTLN